MSAVLKTAQVARLMQAGRIDRTDPVAEVMPPAVDPAIEQITGQISELSAKLNALGKDQLKLVMESARKAEENSDAIVTALVSMLESKARPVKENWVFKVTERDYQGRIVSIEAQQVNDK